MNLKTTLFFVFCICLIFTSCGRANRQTAPADLTQQLIGPWLRNIPKSKEVDGYYFGPEGSLKLINIFSMQADGWSLKENLLTITTHTERYPTPQPIEYTIESISENELHLERDGYQTVYHRPRYTTELTNTRWVPKFLPGTSPKVQTERETFLQFTTVDKLRGFAGCNRFSGSYSTVNQTLTFGPLLTTKMYCTNIQYEDELFGAISDSNNYMIVENQLFLFNGPVLQAILEAMYYQ